jgi:hypothetical protein
MYKVGAIRFHNNLCVMLNIKFQVYTNLNKLILQMKEMSWSDRVGIAITLFLWFACISIGTMMVPIIKDMLR